MIDFKRCIVFYFILVLLFIFPVIAFAQINLVRIRVKGIILNLQYTFVNQMVRWVILFFQDMRKRHFLVPNCCGTNTQRSQFSTVSSVCCCRWNWLSSYVQR